MEVLQYFGTLTGLVALIVLIINWIIKFIELLKKSPIEKKWVKQVISWVISIAVAIVGFVFSLGLFEPFHLLPEWQGWLYTIIYGFFIGLCANGFFNIPGVEKVLDAIMTLIQFVLDLLKKTKYVFKIFKKKE